MKPRVRLLPGRRPRPGARPPLPLAPAYSRPGHRLASPAPAPSPAPTRGPPSARGGGDRALRALSEVPAPRLRRAVIPAEPRAPQAGRARRPRGEPLEPVDRNASQVGREAARQAVPCGRSNPAPGLAPAAPARARRVCAPLERRSFPRRLSSGSGSPGGAGAWRLREASRTFWSFPGRPESPAQGRRVRVLGTETHSEPPPSPGRSQFSRPCGVAYLLRQRGTNVGVAHSPPAAVGRPEGWRVGAPPRAYPGWRGGRAVRG